MDKITTVGIDLAKNVFSLNAVDAVGKTVLRRTLRRDQLESAVAKLPPCVIGMEACSGAHEWARRFARYGHTVKVMAPKFVAPYRKSGKNDGNDLEAMCEAVSRPSMRFVRTCGCSTAVSRRTIARSNARPSCASRRSD